MIKKIDDKIVVNCTYHSIAHFEKEDYQTSDSKKGWVAINDFRVLFDESGKRLDASFIIDLECIIHEKDDDKIRLSEEDRKQVEQLCREDIEN